MQKIVFSFARVCVSAPHGAPCVLWIGRYINIDARAAHCVFVCSRERPVSAGWSCSWRANWLYERHLHIPVMFGVCQRLRARVWMSRCVDILHLCSLPHQYALFTSSLPSSVAHHSCQAFQWKVSSSGSGTINNIPQCHMYFCILSNSILCEHIYVIC